VARGKASANPILDTRTYNVEFPYGRSEEYTANIITGNMYAQCDEERNQFLMLQDIVGHKLMGTQWSALTCISRLESTNK
jgi:hypothetical protein